MATKHKNTACPAGAKAVFSKEKILGLPQYGRRRDLLCALLAEGKNYTLDEAEGLIETFMKGKVH